MKYFPIKSFPHKTVSPLPYRFNGAFWDAFYLDLWTVYSEDFFSFSEALLTLILLVVTAFSLFKGYEVFSQLKPLISIKPVLKLTESVLN